MTTVQSILNVKGHFIATGRPEMSLAEVCAILAEKRIGALVMTDDAERVVGIVSERDIVRVLASHGPGVLEDPAAGHMTRAVKTCSPHVSLDEVMEMMTRGRFRHVPVAEGGRLVGVISIGDVVKHRMSEIEREADAIRSYIATA